MVDTISSAGSTFIAGEPTDAYRQLWFLWTSLMNRVGGDGAVFFALVDLTTLVLLIGLLLVLERCLRAVTGNDVATIVGASVAATPPRWAGEVARRHRTHPSEVTVGVRLPRLSGELLHQRVRGRNRRQRLPAVLPTRPRTVVASGTPDGDDHLQGLRPDLRDRTAPPAPGLSGRSRRWEARLCKSRRWVVQPADW